MMPAITIRNLSVETHRALKLRAAWHGRSTEAEVRRMLPFDPAASGTFAGLMARVRANGEAIGKADGFIAAIAALHGLAVATREPSPFMAAGVAAIDPWKD